MKVKYPADTSITLHPLAPDVVRRRRGRRTTKVQEMTCINLIMRNIRLAEPQYDGDQPPDNQHSGGVVDSGERSVWLRNIEKLAERSPALLELEDQELVGRHGPLHFPHMILVELDGSLLSS